MDASVLNRLFNRITQERIDKFLNLLNELSLQDEAEEITEFTNTYWALDSTSISTHSHNLSCSAYGHNKDGDELPQVNVLMVVNQRTGAPIYYRTYNGNVTDISTVKFMLQEKARINLDSNAVFVADKGYSSILNIHRFYQNHCSFLVNVKTGLSFCKNLIKQHRVELLDPLNSSDEIKTRFITTEFDWSYPVNFKTDCKHRQPHLKEKIYVHMYYEQNIYNDWLNSTNEKIATTARLIKEGKPVPVNYKFYEEKFLIKNLDEHGNLISLKTNLNELDKYLSSKGIRILLSDCVKDPVEAYKAYFDRNEVEYAFNMYKQRLGGNRMRVSSDSSLCGKAFIQFIATSIAIMFRKRVAKAAKRNNAIRALSYDSDSVVISKLNTIKQIKFELGSYFTEVVGGLKILLNEMQISLPTDKLEDLNYEQDRAAEEQELIDNEVASTSIDTATSVLN